MNKGLDKQFEVSSIQDIKSQLKKDNSSPYNLKITDRITLKEKAKLVDQVMDAVETSNFAEDNNLIKCGALVITPLTVMKEIKHKKGKEPFWKKKQLSHSYRQNKPF